MKVAMCYQWEKANNMTIKAEINTMKHPAKLMMSVAVVQHLKSTETH